MTHKYTTYGACLQSHPTPGEPFSITRTKEGGLALVLCDGTGSWTNGMEGSRRGATLFGEALLCGPADPRERLLAAFRAASARVVEELYEDDDMLPASPAFCAAVALVLGKEAHLAWAGDCQAYLIRAGQIAARTVPHTLPRLWVERGEITEEQAKEAPIARYADVVARCVASHVPGQDDPNPPEYSGPWLLSPGDRLFLCSRRIVQNIAVEEICARGHRSAEALVGELLPWARQRGEPGDYIAVALAWDD